MNVNHEGSDTVLGGAAAPVHSTQRPPCPKCAAAAAKVEANRLAAARRIPPGVNAYRTPPPFRIRGGSRRSRRRPRHTRKLVRNR